MDDRSALASGFTIVEMLVVVALLGLLGMLVLQAGQPASSRTAAERSAARIMAAARLARSDAVTRGRPSRLVLDLQGRRIAVLERPAETMNPDLAISVVAADGLVAGNRAEIGFFPDGSSTGGRVMLSGGGTRAVVAIHWLTGRAHMERPQ